VTHLHRRSYSLPLAWVDPLIVHPGDLWIQDSARYYTRRFWLTEQRTVLSLVRPFFYFSVYSPFFVHFLEYLFFLQTSPIHPSPFSILFLSGRLFYFIFFFNTTSFSISHFLGYWPYGSGGSLGSGYLGWTRPRAQSSPQSTLLLSLFPRLGPIVRDSEPSRVHWLLRILQ
jgi:hypothetical protein